MGRRGSGSAGGRLLQATKADPATLRKSAARGQARQVDASALGHRTALLLLQAACEVVQHLEAELGQVLDGKQTSRPVHRQQFGVVECPVAAETARVGIDQGPDSDAAAGADGVSERVTSAQLNRPGHNTVKILTEISRPEEDPSGVELACPPRSRQCSDGGGFVVDLAHGQAARRCNRDRGGCNGPEASGAAGSASDGAGRSNPDGAGCELG